MSGSDIRVFLVDDHPVVRQGLRATLEDMRNIEVVGEAATVAEGKRGLVLTRPDVGIVDLRLPDGSGVGLIRDVRSVAPQVHCIIFTSFADDEAFFHSLMAGASGYIVKDAQPSELRRVVEAAARGESLITPEVLDELRGRTHDGPLGDTLLEAELLAGFTPQERRILMLVIQGRTNREIASGLSLAEKTVRNYVSNILAKAGMRNRTQLATHYVLLARRSSH